MDGPLARFRIRQLAIFPSPVNGSQMEDKNHSQFEWTAPFKWARDLTLYRVAWHVQPSGEASSVELWNSLAGEGGAEVLC